MKHRLILIVTLTAVFAATSAPVAQEKIDTDIQWKIRREATENSQIMRTLHFLTDVYGPRLTGSPNLKAAQDWVVQGDDALGVEERAPRAVDFGHPGLGEREARRCTSISPVKDSLVAEALAWTPGTNGAGHRAGGADRSCRRSRPRTC